MNMPTQHAPERKSIPAAQVLATVDRLRHAHLVHLPPQFAAAAVMHLFRVHNAAGSIVDGPATEGEAGFAIGEGEWAIRWAPGIGAPLHFAGPSFPHGRDRVFKFARYTVALAPPDAARLLRCLEAVKPDELDATGRPLPWVPVRHQVESLGTRHADDDDAREVSDATALPRASADDVPSERERVAEWLAALCASAGLPMPELRLARAPGNRLGFTSGRIWYDPTGTPLRVHLSLCPNADPAEIVATLAHELAHAKAGVRGHELAFKTTFVELASRHFGARWFDGARTRLPQSYRVVDNWVASGIRAALRGGEPPSPRVADDGQLAKVLMRIKKLRDLAADQQGLPEGIAATATANDLITTYGLEGYGVRIDGAVHDQLVDMFVPLEEGARWRRTLAHAVAVYCDVFSLAMSSTQRMHFFGRHTDVVTAEYLYCVSAARITRECASHIARWKSRRGGSTAGETRSEKTSFCDSAAVAFQQKLVQLKAEDGTRADSRTGSLIERAEDFAEDEHAKRGQSWASGGRRAYRDNAAGREVGSSMEVVRGIGGADEKPKGLPHR